MAEMSYQLEEALAMILPVDPKEHNGHRQADLIMANLLGKFISSINQISFVDFITTTDQKMSSKVIYQSVRGLHFEFLLGDRP